MNIKRTILLAAAWLAGFGSQANTEPHQAFLKVEKLAERGSEKDYRNAISQLDHPLKPYAELAYLQRNLNTKHQQEIANFLNIYQGTPLEWPLRKEWLYELKSRKNKATFIEFYKPTRDAELSCTYLSYQLQLNAPEKAIYQQVDELWNVAKSQPKACDWLFSKWQKAGYLTEQLAWQRIGKVAQSGDVSLLPFLARSLPKQKRYLTELYKTVRQDPSAAAGLYRYKKRSVEEAEIALYGIKRLVWRDRDLALKAWLKLEKMFTYSEQQKQDLYYVFATSLASAKHKQAKFFLNKVKAENHDDKLMQWQLTNMLREQDWAGIIAYLRGKTLTNGATYWLAYAHDKRGDKALANSMWQALAQKRDYYGFLAAARTGVDVSMQYQPAIIEPQAQQMVANAPGYKRAKALYELDRFNAARSEWNSLTGGLTKQEKLAAASLANEIGWHDSVIRLLAEIQMYHLLDYRFPTPYEKLFARFGKNNNVDKSWSYAISRRESSFASDAFSSAGAVGLMQLLPSTASYIHRSRISRKQLMDAKLNIELGNKYLKYLKEKTGGNEVIATASYNAGYHKVKRWLPKEAVDLDIWVESIPYRETRNYVKNVFAYRQVYLTRMGDETNLFEQLVAMKIKR